MNSIDDLNAEILQDLLADFQAKGLGADALDYEYEGVALASLAAKYVGAGGHIRVDFDLALEELEQGKLVDTGPKEPYENDPSSSLVVIMPFSKREYVYLTKNGYKVAREETQSKADICQPMIGVTRSQKTYGAQITVQVKTDDKQVSLADYASIGGFAVSIIGIIFAPSLPLKAIVCILLSVYIVYSVFSARWARGLSRSARLAAAATVVVFSVGGLGWLLYSDASEKAPPSGTQDIPKVAEQNAPPANPPVGRADVPKVEELKSGLVPPPAKPVVALRIVNPIRPAVVLDNQSDAIVRETRYHFMLWNLDGLNKEAPLPITAKTVPDFIRVHSYLGPTDIFSEVGGSIGPGDRLAGAATVECAECSDKQIYWIYIVWGKGGWFYHLPKAQPGEAPKGAVHFDDLIHTMLADPDNFFAPIPETERVPITRLR